MTITPGHLLDLAEQHGDTPGSLARRAQVDPGNLDAYLQGRGQPCPMEQRRIALALGVDVRELHDDTETAA